MPGRLVIRWCLVCVVSSVCLVGILGSYDGSNFMIVLGRFVLCVEGWAY